MKRLIAQTLKQMMGENYLDDYNRIDAITYINGEIYETQMHADAINEWLTSQNLQGDFNSVRPSKKNIDNKTDANAQIAFAHLVIEDAEPCIFLETDTMQNVDKDTVVSALKQKYPGDHIYLFVNSEDSTVKRIAKRLVKKSNFFNTIKFINPNYKSEPKDYEIFLNPDTNELKEVSSTSGAARGVITNNGDIYIWSSDLLHSDAIKQGNVPNGITFVLKGNYFLVDQYSMDINNPQIAGDTFIKAMPNLKNLGLNENSNVSMDEAAWKNINTINDLCGLAKEI